MAAIHPQKIVGNWQAGIALDFHTSHSIPIGPNAHRTTGKNVLLFDDLFRSGATLNAITGLLLRQGQAASVRVLTITRTRSNQ